MTPLQSRALARETLDQSQVESTYAANARYGSGNEIVTLCESHERLRAELEGATVLLAENESTIARLLLLIEDNKDRLINQHALIAMGIDMRYGPGTEGKFK